MITLIAGVQQQFADHFFQLGGVFGNAVEADFHIIRPLQITGVVELKANTGNRRTQLVGHRIDQHFVAFDQLLNLLGHGVEVPIQMPQLMQSTDLGANVKTAFSKSPIGVLQVADTAENIPCPQAHQQDQNQKIRQHGGTASAVQFFNGRDRTKADHVVAVRHFAQQFVIAQYHQGVAPKQGLALVFCQSQRRQRPHLKGNIAARHPFGLLRPLRSWGIQQQLLGHIEAAFKVGNGIVFKCSGRHRVHDLRYKSIEGEQRQDQQQIERRKEFQHEAASGSVRASLVASR